MKSIFTQAFKEMDEDLIKGNVLKRDESGTCLCVAYF